jgi:hypothetical protein
LCGNDTTFSNFTALKNVVTRLAQPTLKIAYFVSGQQPLHSDVWVCPVQLNKLIVLMCFYSLRVTIWAGLIAGDWAPQVTVADDLYVEVAAVEVVLAAVLEGIFALEIVDGVD